MRFLVAAVLVGWVWASSHSVEARPRANKSKATDEEIVVVDDDAPTKKPRSKKRRAADEVVVVDDDKPARSRSSRAKPSKRDDAADDARPLRSERTKHEEAARAAAREAARSKSSWRHDDDDDGGEPVHSDKPHTIRSSRSHDVVVVDDAKPTRRISKSKSSRTDNVVVVDDDPKPTRRKSRAIKSQDDEVIVVDDDAKPAHGKKPAKHAAAVDDDAKPARAKQAKRDDVTVVDDDDKPAATDDGEAIAVIAPSKRQPKAKLKLDPDADVRPASKDDGAAKQSAHLDADGDEVDEAPVAVTRSFKQTKPTRFYFRAGGFKSSTKLGGTEFALHTDLPVDTSSLGSGSGVVLDQKQYPVGVIVGYVLPVLHRKLSVETILGFPTATRFRATGALADQSLAPTFMGMQTGIPALGPNLGEATFTTPVVTGVYRIAELGRVTPIAGAGVMVLMARNAKITNPVLNEAGDPKLKITPSPGLALQAGLDIHLFGRVSARLEGKTVLGMKVKATVEDIAVTPKAIPALGSIEVGDAVLSAKVTPYVVQVGIGADF